MYYTDEKPGWFRVHDRTIPNRKQQTEREEERKTDELIRLALQQSATEAVREGS